MTPLHFPWLLASGIGAAALLAYVLLILYLHRREWIERPWVERVAQLESQVAAVESARRDATQWAIEERRKAANAQGEAMLWRAEARRREQEAGALDHQGT